MQIFKENSNFPLKQSPEINTFIHRELNGVANRKGGIKKTEVEMKKSAYKIFVVFFLAQFLLWMQLGAAQLYCQCDHSIAEASCHVSQAKIAEDSCCENPPTSKADNNLNETPPGCHKMAKEEPGAKDVSCCSNDNESAEAAVSYSTPAHYCQSACVNVVTTHSKQVTAPDPGKKVQYLPLLQKVDTRNVDAIKSLSLSAFQQLEISPHSPPLFLMHSSFLI